MPVQTTTMGAGHEHPWWPCVWQRRADAGVVARDADPTWLLLQRARDGVYALCGEVVATAVRCRTSTTPTTACSTARRPRGAPGTTRPATPQRPAGGRVQDAAFASLGRDQASRARRRVASAPR